MIRFLIKIKKHFFHHYNYIDDYYYEKISNEFNDLNTYLIILNQTKKNVTLKTKAVICFSEKITFGEKKQNIVKVLKRPKCIIKCEKVEILIYKLLIGRHRIKCQFHLFEGKLFFYNYTFPYVNNNQKNEILDVLHQKYIDSKYEMGINNIVDDYSSLIFVKDEFELSINYISLESKFLKSLELFSTVKEKHEENEKKKIQERMYRHL
ncbi:hypothetical protein NAT51_16710 [Flavobacterium amniphilum]|uniref:hypothetical protein n=1 Tax=Flavobacterium amniphilum TaxID=1834035 RepID=UPI002029E2B6|nr:hypothetical protein [Flavobacterium amniphilum]MCL9807177.1 hypothetical protein [Flavobacterium amniphilum]